MKIEKWNEAENGELNFENICQLYSSDKNIRFEEKPPIIRAFRIFDENRWLEIRWNRYQSGASSNGEKLVSSDYFILKGKCEITIKGETDRLQKGDWIEFPNCKYQLTVIGTEDFEYVAVYKLPKDISTFK